MTFLVFIPILFFVVGLLLFQSTQPKVARIGEVLFTVGAVFTCWLYAGKQVRFP